jgi:hypothetical protein
MFDNYNKPTYDFLMATRGLNVIEDQKSSTVKALFNKNHEFYGIEAQYLMPFSLYFHLTEAADQALDSFIKECRIEFSIYSTPTHKTVLLKSGLASSYFDDSINDIKIEVSQEEAQLLKQETYQMSLKLIHPTRFYILHSESDGVLMIR